MRAIVFCAAAIALLATGTGVATATTPIRVTATHGSGSIAQNECDVGAFKISIQPNGKTFIWTLTWRHNRSREATRTLSLTSAQLKSIEKAVIDNRFFRLPPTMEGGAEDSPVYTLDILLADQHRKVRVHAPAFYSDKSVLRRFRLVWAAVSAAVRFTEDPEALRHLKANS